MDNRGAQKTLNAMHVVLLVGIVVLLGLTVYNYSQTGRFNFSSLVIAIILLVLIAIQRTTMMKKQK